MNAGHGAELFSGEKQPAFQFRRQGDFFRVKVAVHCAFFAEYLTMEEIGKKKKMTFTSVVLDLLRQGLKEMGITVGIGREAGIGLPSSFPD